MKRVLILSYYFPPSNATAANRVKSWEQFFGEKNILPIVITRDWNSDNEFESSSLNQVVVERTSMSEIHYVPFLGNRRTRLSGTSRRLGKLQRKLYTLVELFAGNSQRRILPYYNLMAYAEEYAKKFRPDLVLISGSPFQLFSVGWKIKKELNIPWIADYRDAWTSHDVPIVSIPIASEFQRWVDRYFERKWLKSAHCFTTVSGYLKNMIGKRLGLSGFVIFNGSNNNFHPQDEIVRTDNSFTLLYSGELYSNQDYIKLIEVFKKFSHNSEQKKTLIFLGAKDSYHKIPDSVVNATTTRIKLTKRVDLDEALKYHQQADCFLMLNYNGMKGIPSSKVFDYIAMEKPFILFKSDNDIIEEIAIKSHLGIVTNTEEELLSVLEDLYKEKIKTGLISVKPDTAYIKQFTRRHQAYKLADLITTELEK